MLILEIGGSGTVKDKVTGIDVLLYTHIALKHFAASS